MTDSISLGTIWEETAIFVRAEAGLLLPVAFAVFGLPLVALQLVLPDRMIVAGQVAAGPWLWAFLPYALINMLGSIALSALVIHPGISVREAIIRAARAMPAGIGLMLLGVAGIVILSIAASIVGGVEQAVLGRPGPFFPLMLLVCLVVAITVAVRALPVWAILAEGSVRPAAALRRAFAITRRAYIRLLLLRIVAWIAQTVTLLVVLMPFAVVFGLIGRALGETQVTELLILVAGGAAVSVVMTIWTVYVARLYRRLEASSGI